MAGVPGTVWQPRGRRRRRWQPATGRLRHFRLHFLEVSHLINQECVADPVRRGYESEDIHLVELLGS